MHQKRTKVVERTESAVRKLGRGSGLVRHAKNLQYRGVITTYKVHDKLLSNRLSRRRFEQDRPALDDVQRRILAQLDEHDFVVVPFSDLVPDEALRERIFEDGAAFIADTERQLTEELAGARDDVKDYLVRRYKRVSEVGLDSPWLAACLSDRMLDLANAYLRMWSKLEYVDFWYSVPVEAGSGRVQSQRWHRDFDDRHLLKAFLYLVDVDEGTGPFEFVAGSARGGTLAELYPWYPLSPAYPKEHEFDTAVPAEAMRTFTGPKGTLVLCNTSGFHRGGFATASPRVLATATYCSPASLKSLTEQNYRLPRGTEKDLSAAQRYAVG